MGSYTTGYRLEQRIQKVYTKHGWLATRFPKSGRKIHPADVLALKRIGKQTYVHLIECKNASKKDHEKKTIYIQAKQIKRLLRTAEKYQTQAMIAYSFPHQHARILPAKRLKSSGMMLSIKREDGIPIKQFLKTFI
jgi:Holliday junction resolvase